MNHSLPKLAYAQNELEPILSERTLQFHYGKHHQAYVDNLNKLIPGTKFEDMSLTDIVKT
ncbi:MAG: superoxide dismutase [Fe], partial [Bacteroidota bacterium]|nr:superoxide dismutase [Fe] [Bacteroidota bacterium]